VKIELPLLRFVILDKGREIFASKSLENRSFKYGMGNMIPILVGIYGHTYAHFDKKEKDGTKSFIGLLSEEPLRPFWSWLVMLIKLAEFP
jgi:hypothetical protein